MKRTVLIVVLITLCQMPLSFAQSPQRMSYQGALTDTQGRPVPDGPVSLTFRLYDVATEATELWQETQPVTITDGTFNVVLGSVKPLNAPLDKPYWLGIAVGNGSELTPRVALTAWRDNLKRNSVENLIVKQTEELWQRIGKEPPTIKTDNDVLINGTTINNGDFAVLGDVFFGGRSVHRGIEEFQGGILTNGGARFGDETIYNLAEVQRDQSEIPNVLFSGRDTTGSDTAGVFISVSGERPGAYVEKRPPAPTGKLSTTDVMNEHLETLNQATAAAQNDLPVELSQFLQQQQSNPSIWGVSAMPNTEAILGQNSVTTNTSPAVRGVHQGLGVGVNGQIANADSTAPAVWGFSNGTGSGVAATMTGNGTGLLVDHNGMTGNLAVFRSNNANQVRFTKEGRGHFNGGTENGGADVAEAFEVEGLVTAYEPGDVLVISTSRDRTVEKSSKPYSTVVAGVYSTKSGVLLTERNVDDSHEDTVPLGIVGVIPTKVSSENGPICRGDLLATSSVPGHAMKGTDQSRLAGAVLGKALENFDGQGTGVIKVLVTVK